MECCCQKLGEMIIQAIRAVPVHGPVVKYEPPLSELEAGVLQGKMGFEDAVKAFKHRLIVRALEAARFNQSQAAKSLKTSRRILGYEMEKLGILIRKEI